MSRHQARCDRQYCQSAVLVLLRMRMQDQGPARWELHQQAWIPAHRVRRPRGSRSPWAWVPLHKTLILTRRFFTADRTHTVSIFLWLHPVQCSAVQCSAVQCSAVQCSAATGADTSKSNVTRESGSTISSWRKELIRTLWPRNCRHSLPRYSRRYYFSPVCNFSLVSLTDLHSCHSGFLQLSSRSSIFREQGHFCPETLLLVGPSGSWGWRRGHGGSSLPRKAPRFATGSRALTSNERPTYSFVVCY